MISINTEIRSRRGKLIGIVTESDGKSFTFTRPTGKTIRITASKIKKTLQRLQQGETLRYQANPGGGGISYTVAIERGVIAGLGDQVTDTGKGYVLA
tara:strand:- start:2543 stop:2833 length:291 start_codon:yes stop_codon:yes gene_type:complete